MEVCYLVLLRDFDQGLLRRGLEQFLRLNAWSVMVKRELKEADNVSIIEW